MERQGDKMRANQQQWCVMGDLCVELCLLKEQFSTGWIVVGVMGRELIDRTQIFDQESEACLRCAELCEQRARELTGEK